MPPPASSFAVPARGLLRLEGASVFLLSLFAYWRLGGDGWIFVILFLLPDLTLLAYLKGPRLGALAYNFGHSYLVPIAIGLMGWLWAPALLSLALIWLAHIGMDRAFGYGLKSFDGFHWTHLGPVGGSR